MYLALIAMELVLKEVMEQRLAIHVKVRVL